MNNIISMSKNDMPNVRKIKVVKTSLVKITDNRMVIRKINEVAKRCSIITNDICNFLKLYFIHLYDQEMKLPKIDIDLLVTIFNIVTNGSKSGRKITKNKTLNDKLSFGRCGRCLHRPWHRCRSCICN